MDVLLTVKNVAERLNVSVRQVWKLSASGRLPGPIRLARSARWRESDIDQFIASCRGTLRWTFSVGGSSSHLAAWIRRRGHALAKIAGKLHCERAVALELFPRQKKYIEAYLDKPQ